MLLIRMASHLECPTHQQVHQVLMELHPLPPTLLITSPTLLLTEACLQEDQDLSHIHLMANNHNNLDIQMLILPKGHIQMLPRMLPTLMGMKDPLWILLTKGAQVEDCFQGKDFWERQ